MNADNYRRKAQHFLALARQITRAEDRAVLISIAAFWMERAEEAEQDKRAAQGHREMQPEESEGNGR